MTGASIGEHADVFELWLVVTAEDYPEALAFYRDVFGLAELETYTVRRGHVPIHAGRATLELNDPPYAEYIDEVEVGRRVGSLAMSALLSGYVTAQRRPESLLTAGADLIAAPTDTPWNSRNSRLEAPAGLQLTFSPICDLERPSAPGSRRSPIRSH